MGWSYGPRSKGVSHLEYFRQNFDCESFHLLDTVGTLRTVYGAAEIRRPNQAPFVIGLVIHIHWVPNDPHYNFGYKETSEEMGPIDSNCPRRILDQLTPLAELEDRGIFTGNALEWATRWRAECEANLAKRDCSPA